MTPAVTTRSMKGQRCRNWNFDYADEPEVPCECRGRANSDSNLSCNSTEVTDPSEDSDWSSTTDTSDRAPPTMLDPFPSADDLQRLLREQCPQEYTALPTSSTLKFEDWKGSWVQKRNRIGTIHTPFDSVRHTVYAFMGGDNRNRVCLTQGSANKPLRLVDAEVVELDEPFFSICWNGRLLHNEEKTRLRALLCFWFFTAGYLPSLPKYKGLEKHLVEACQWLGGAIIEQEKVLHLIPEGGVTPGSDQVSEANTTPQSARRPVDWSSTPKRRNRLSQHEQIQEGVVEPPAKRTKLEDAISSTRRRLAECRSDIEIVERELAALHDSMRQQVDLGTKIAEQAQEITELEGQLRNEQAAHISTRNQYACQCRRGEGLQAELRQSEEIRRKEKKESATRDKALRLEAERKLKEYVDAQKKMAAQFA